MSRPHMRAGVCRYFALPLYPASAAVAAHSALDILIDDRDSTLNVPLFGAFWNTRPIASSELGEEVGRIRSEQLLVDLYLLRGGVDEETRKHWRFGRDAMLTPKIRAAREDETRRWLTMRARSGTSAPGVGAEGDSPKTSALGADDVQLIDASSGSREKKRQPDARP